MKYETVVRGKMTYYITDTAVLVSVGGSQYISYNVYNTPSRSSLGEFKKKVLSSGANQYNNVVDQMDLAQKCKLVGTGTTKPGWIK